MTKYRVITDISLATDMISIYRKTDIQSADTIRKMRFGSVVVGAEKYRYRHRYPEKVLGIGLILKSRLSAQH